MKNTPRRKTQRRGPGVWLDLAAKGSVAIAMILALGCGFSDNDTPDEPNACIAGEQKPAEDGCNTCTCDDNGNWACTKIACPTLCTPGDTTQQDCNSCSCNERGMWICTQIACEEPKADLGQACSMYGTKCQDTLTCQYQCPDPQADPNNCNLGINPTGVCVQAPAPAPTPR